jgi:CelD/BcsL family acetyltransferase involved in cellulose biosynthesis
VPDLDIQDIATAEELEALAPEWTRLWQRASHATPFQAPAWLIPWWRHFGTSELLVLCARESGELVGLLPLYILDEPPVRKLLPLGIGNSDWLDALCAPGREREVAESLMPVIAEHSHRFDACDLQPLPARSGLLEADPAGLADERVTLEPCPALLLKPAGGELETALPRAMRQDLRYYRRRAGKVGQLRFEAAQPDSLGELLKAFYALHGARWRRQGLCGVLADDAVRGFHAEAAPALMAMDALRLYALRLDERIVAALYGFMTKGRFYHYLAGFDPDLARLGLGTLMIGHALEQAVREGAEEFDFLRGGEPYKYRWGATDRPSYGRRLQAHRPGFRI